MDSRIFARKLEEGIKAHVAMTQVDFASLETLYFNVRDVLNSIGLKCVQDERLGFMKCDVYQCYHNDFVKIFNNLVESKDEEKINRAFKLLDKMTSHISDSHPFCYYARKRELIGQIMNNKGNLDENLFLLANLRRCNPKMVDLDPLMPLNVSEKNGNTEEKAAPNLVNRLVAEQRAQLPAGQ